MRARVLGTACTLRNHEMSPIPFSDASEMISAYDLWLTLHRRCAFTHNLPTDYFLPSRMGAADEMHFITHTALIEPNLQREAEGEGV